ncbi:MAG: hypothetical protein HQM08_27630 [Candidatus Riflebacteria bacterium]|nr:hypothetical protein [Candidatus Riflebacteria bacterium]
MESKQLLMRVPEEIAKKFKVVASLQGRTMTEVFIEFVNDLENFDIPALQKKKTSTKAKPTATKKALVEPDFRLVDVRHIKVKPPIKPVQISKIVKDLAGSIVKIGIIKPIILLKLRNDDYQLLSSEIEFQAVRRAKQLDPKKREMVNAFIVSKDAMGEVLKQSKILEKLKYYI